MVLVSDLFFSGPRDADGRVGGGVDVPARAVREAGKSRDEGIDWGGGGVGSGGEGVDEADGGDGDGGGLGAVGFLVRGAEGVGGFDVDLEIRVSITGVMQRQQT